MVVIETPRYELWESGFGRVLAAAWGFTNGSAYINIFFIQSNSILSDCVGNSTQPKIFLHSENRNNMLRYSKSFELSFAL